MNSKRFGFVLAAALFLLFVRSEVCADLIYNNSSTSYYYFEADRYVEYLDYGRSQGGQVTSFTIGYYADNSNTVSARVRFYKYTDSYNIPGTHVRTLTLSMPGVAQGGVTTYTHTVPEISKFSLPSGDFGYSLEFLSYNGEPLLAHGGEGNENVLMYFDDFLDIWRGTYFSDQGVPWAGLYMKIYAQEPAVCDFSGYVYEDVNEDGQKDSGDNPLQGWQIFADYDGDRQLDSNEPYDLSASDGSYDLRDVEIDSFDAICQVTKTGFKPVNPESGFYQIWVSENGSYTLDFGNKEVGMADICGYKFEDVDADGIWDDGEPTLPGWMIFLDTNDDGVWQSGEPNAVTDPNGFYEFVDIEAPASYTITEQMQDGWRQTFPGGTETYEVAVEPNDLLCDYDFGNTTEPEDLYVTISGRVTLSDGRGLEGVRVIATDTYLVVVPQSTYQISFGYYESVLSDENGYYQLSAPFNSSCLITAKKSGWQFMGTGLFPNITTNLTVNIDVYWPYSGGLGTEVSPCNIANPSDLQAIGEHPEDWSKHFVLTADINMSGYSFSQALVAPDTEPSLGTHQGPRFNGILNGNGHVISNLKIHSPSNDAKDCIALFGGIDEDCQISNLGLVDVDIAGIYYQGWWSDYVAALCASNHGGIIDNCYVTGKIKGYAYVGGICASNYDGTISNSFVNAVVQASEWSGSVCGYINNGVINNCYAKGSFTGGSDVGGVCGYALASDISNCYSAVTITGNENVGAVCGFSNSTILDCFWDSQICQVTYSAGGTSLTTEQMHNMDNFINAGWDFENTWRMCDGFNYPRLQWEEKITGDIVCPDGVGMEDFYQLAAQWQMTKLSGDFHSDGIVDLDDWCMLSSAWNTGLGEADYEQGCDISVQGGNGIIDVDDLAVFSGQWLNEGLYSADIYPESGDDVVNNGDLNAIIVNWLAGRE
ncbi:MAG: GLUG motif-containing protein [Sedimentisphaeraceae bacterium JB056]